MRTDAAYFNVDHIFLSPSPIKQEPSVFRRGILFNSDIHAEITRAAAEIQEQCLFDEQDLVDRRGVELEELPHIIRSSQPVDDEQAQVIMQHLDRALQTTAMAADDKEDSDNDNDQISVTSTMISTHPYPPITQQGLIADHDRPYADYGHLGRHISLYCLYGRCGLVVLIFENLDAKSIAEECQLVLDCRRPQDCHTPRGAVRLSAKSFAITCWTNVSSEYYRYPVPDQYESIGYS